MQALWIIYICRWIKKKLKVNIMRYGTVHQPATGWVLFSLCPFFSCILLCIRHSFRVFYIVAEECCYSAGTAIYWQTRKLQLHPLIVTKFRSFSLVCCIHLLLLFFRRILLLAWCGRAWKQSNSSVYSIAHHLSVWVSFILFFGLFFNTSVFTCF